MSAPFVILIPVYDEWPIASRLLVQVDAALAAAGLEAVALLVDDGSTVPFEDALEVAGLPRRPGLAGVEVLRLRRNLGHQRAIAVALCHVHDRLAGRDVVVMDGDGEDDPADLPRLVEALSANGGRKIVFAARERRSETVLFQLFYRLYQLLHLVLTGRGIRFGNFSAVPPRALERLVVTSEIWNHYAAAVVNARIEHTTIPTRRAPRLGGRSTMGFTALVVHGLSALSVYSHVIGVRLLFALCALVGLAGVSVAAVALRVGPAELLPFFLPLGLPLLAGAALLLQAVIGAVLFVFLMLAGRQSSSFIPARDFHHFIAEVVPLAGSEAPEDAS